MGIGLQALQLTFSLWQDGHLKNCKSVMEIGSQDIQAHHDHVAAALKRVSNFSRSDDAITPAIFYSQLGINQYRCIDADGRHNALVFDLNKDILKEYQYTEKFDLVTNHGTTEHCFDQCQAFRNIHNLCAPGGLMIHALPFQGYLNHGFYNYQPSFYYDLAMANGYALVGMFLNMHSESGDIAPYSDEMMRYLYLPPGTNMLLFAVLKKTGDGEFVVPFNGQYLEGSLLQTEDCRVTKQFFPGERLDRSTDVASMSTRRIAKLLLNRIFNRASTLWLK
ncbi:MAG: hypothetical protein Q7U07_04290 [Gammaproteobacteria bacterium]|nr:hypothetical protein [Gammaproteobacteria bacterium]